MKSGLKRAIWRSRAVAIIGFLVILLALFQGLPPVLENTLFVVFGFLTVSFGIAGSRHKAYADQPRPEPSLPRSDNEKTKEPVVLADDAN